MDFSPFLQLFLVSLLGAGAEPSAIPHPYCHLPSSIIVEMRSVPTQYGAAGYVIDKPGLYSLQRNLAYSTLDVGILILSGNVVLDLGGHTISDQSGISTAILIRDAASRVTVRNGILAGGHTGIDAQGGRLLLDRASKRSPPTRYRDPGRFWCVT